MHATYNDRGKVYSEKSNTTIWARADLPDSRLGYGVASINTTAGMLAIGFMIAIVAASAIVTLNAFEKAVAPVSSRPRGAESLARSVKASDHSTWTC
jgi:hypothetical protein